MVDVHIRQMRIDDSRQVAALVKDSFDDSLWPYIAYAQPGAENYLAVSFHYPNLITDQCQLVATAGKDSCRVIAFAAFRVKHEGGAFLSYICVAAEAKGMGVATALMERFLSQFPDLTHLTLDTFEDNAPARSLYAKLGFTTIGRSLWIDRPLPTAGGAVTVSSPHASLASYDRYGFCELLLDAGTKTVNLGLLGGSIIRCFSRESFQDDLLLAGVRRLFPDTNRAFVVLSEAPKSDLDVEHRVIKRSLRMSLTVQGSR